MQQDPTSAYPANPSQANPWTSPAPAIAREQPYPIFTQIVAGIDLLLIAIRFLLVVVGAIGLAMMGDELEASKTQVLLEVVTGLLIVFTALPANVLLLIKHRLGVPLAYLACAATLLSLAVALWQGLVLFGERTFGSEAERTGFIFGMIFVLLLRLGIVVAYGAAAWMAQRWHQEQRAAASS